MNLNYTGLGIVRNLAAHREFRIAGLTPENNFACRSRYVDEIRILSPEINESETLAWLLQKGKEQEEKAFIFPTSESDIEFLIKHEFPLSCYYTLSIPDKIIAERILNKYEFYRFLVNNGIDTPETHLIESTNSFERLSRDFPFPCVLKPVFSGDWKTQKASAHVGSQKAMVARNINEAQEIYQKLSVVSKSMILQRIIDSEDADTYSFCCYADNDGNSLWGMVAQKLLQYPPGFGTAVLSKCVSCPEIYDMGERLVRTIGVNGILEVEIIRERNTGRLFVIEINTRHWQQHIIATRRGLNLSLLDFYYRIGNRAKAQELIDDFEANSKNKLTQLTWIDDVSYLFHVFKKRMNANACHFDQIDPKQVVFSVFRLADPIPFIALLKEKICGH